MARYTVAEFGPDYPNGLRCTYDHADTARYAFNMAARRMRDAPDQVRWVNLTRKDRIGRIAYLDHAEHIPAKRAS